MRFYDRVRDTATTTGTSNITVSGAVLNGFATFALRFAVGDRVPYCIVQQSTSVNEWETGLGTMSSSVAFARTDVYESSNSDALVDFAAGTKDVFVPAHGMWMRKTQSAGQILAAVNGMNLP